MDFKKYLNVKSILIGGAAVFLALGAVKSCFAQEFQGIYGHIGAGYYLDVGDHVYLRDNDGSFNTDYKTNPAALFGFYGKWKFKENNFLKVGVDHDSNWLTGPPFNNDAELDITRFVVDYNYCIWFCK